MSKIWYIWAIALAVIGVFGLGWVFLEIEDEKMQASSYSEELIRADEEYLSRCEQWTRLSDEEKGKSPWKDGNYGPDDMLEYFKPGQTARLNANIADFARGVREPHILADVLYGQGWEKKVSKYREKLDTRDNVAIAATLVFAAGIISTLGVTIKLILKRVSDKKKAKQEKVGGKEQKKESAKTKDKVKVAAEESKTQQESHTETEEAEEKEKKPEPVESKSGYFEMKNFVEQQKAIMAPTKEKYTTARKRTETESSTAVAIKIEDHFEPSAEFTSPATLMSTDPVGASDGLMELTQEMSAIRQFAAQQQDRVKQLQDGYDWSIIKRFCLRIIRCIDNLDSRIEKIEGQEHDIVILEDVRDELVFALESSGVEQFEPELESSYKGHERTVEAVRTREKTDNPDLKGMIAKIIRPGYKYVVSDEDVKIVRCSQVRLYG